MPDVLRWYGLSLLIFVLDQWTKWLASSKLVYGQPLEIFSFFNLTLWHNTGAAFSFLSDAGGWQRGFFATVSAIVSVVLVVWIYRLPSQQKMLTLALALILGGAVGNLYDRVTFGYVVDFIDLHYSGYHFPAFNIADSAISVGAAVMLLDMFVHRHEDAGR